MTELLMVTICENEMSALDALTQQVCRWKIKDDAELVFVAEDTVKKAARKTETVCIQFKNLGVAEAFGPEVLNETNREMHAFVSINFLQKLHIPSVDAPGVLV